MKNILFTQRRIVAENVLTFRYGIPFVLYPNISMYNAYDFHRPAQFIFVDFTKLFLKAIFCLKPKLKAIKLDITSNMAL